MANLPATIASGGEINYDQYSMVVETGHSVIACDKTLDAQGHTAAYSVNAYKDQPTAFIPIYFNASNWSTGNIFKGLFYKVHLDYGGTATTQTGLLSGTTSYAFSELTDLTIKNVGAITDSALSYSFKYGNTIPHKLTLENISTIGSYFMTVSNYNGSLHLPDTLVSVSNGFCFNCKKLQELYIPANCPPPTDNESLAVSGSTDPAYATGIILRGPGAAAWKTALPDRDTSPYRKLVLGSSIFTAADFKAIPFK